MFTSNRFLPLLWFPLALLLGDSSAFATPEGLEVIAASSHAAPKVEGRIQSLEVGAVETFVVPGGPAIVGRATEQGIQRDFAWLPDGSTSESRRFRILYESGVSAPGIPGGPVFESRGSTVPIMHAWPGQDVTAFSVAACVNPPCTGSQNLPHKGIWEEGAANSLDVVAYGNCIGSETSACSAPTFEPVVFGDLPLTKATLGDAGELAFVGKLDTQLDGVEASFDEVLFARFGGQGLEPVAQEGAATGIAGCDYITRPFSTDLFEVRPAFGGGVLAYVAILAPAACGVEGRNLLSFDGSNPPRSLVTAGDPFPGRLESEGRWFAGGDFGPPQVNTSGQTAIITDANTDFDGILGPAEDGGVTAYLREDDALPFPLTDWIVDDETLSPNSVFRLTESGELIFYVKARPRGTTPQGNNRRVLIGVKGRNDYRIIAYEGMPLDSVSAPTQGGASAMPQAPAGESPYVITSLLDAGHPPANAQGDVAFIAEFGCCDQSNGPVLTGSGVFVASGDHVAPDEEPGLSGSEDPEFWAVAVSGTPLDLESEQGPALGAVEAFRFAGGSPPRNPLGDDADLAFLATVAVASSIAPQTAVVYAKDFRAVPEPGNLVALASASVVLLTIGRCRRNRSLERGGCGA